MVPSPTPSATPNLTSEHTASPLGRHRFPPPPCPLGWHPPPPHVRSLQAGALGRLQPGCFGCGCTSLLSCCHHVDQGPGSSSCFPRRWHSNLGCGWRELTVDLGSERRGGPTTSLSTGAGRSIWVRSSKEHLGHRRSVHPLSRVPADLVGKAADTTWKVIYKCQRSRTIPWASRVQHISCPYKCLSKGGSRSYKSAHL